MKNTDANRAWLESGPAREFRKTLEAQATLSINELMTAAMESTDPKVRMHATAYATWKRALSEMETKGNDDSE
jgi:hypothetical protein